MITMKPSCLAAALSLLAALSLMPGDAAHAQSARAGSAMRLTITNTACDWGPDFAAYADAEMARRQRAGEDGSSFARVPNRRWRGLTVTAIGIHPDATTVIFRDSVSRVRSTLWAAGMEVNRLGEMPMRNAEAAEEVQLVQGLNPTSGAARRYGAAEITCGL
jgi:muconolactone delta-isomerase